MFQKTVLISDDDPEFVRSLGRLIAFGGYHIVTDLCSDVERLAERYHPDLILLDMQQKIDGRDLLARLKRNPRTTGIKVVMLSALEDRRVRSFCMAMGASAYQTKPVDRAFVSSIGSLTGLQLTA